MSGRASTTCTRATARAGGRAGRRLEPQRRRRGRSISRSAAADGDEVYVPLSAKRHAFSRARSAAAGVRAPFTSPQASVDVNAADAAELAAVPGIGRAVAARIVELREREGRFASLDELLDVAGMTQSRLERARPYLRQP